MIRVDERFALRHLRCMLQTDLLALLLDSGRHVPESRNCAKYRPRNILGRELRTVTSTREQSRQNLRCCCLALRLLRPVSELRQVGANIA